MNYFVPDGSGLVQADSTPHPQWASLNGLMRADVM